MIGIWLDAKKDVTVPVNLMPLINNLDFKSRAIDVVYNSPGMDLVYNFMALDGTSYQTPVIPTASGDYEWTHIGDGMYTIFIPAQGGISINNDKEGFGWFTGVTSNVLPWRSPIIGFMEGAPYGREVALLNSIIGMLQHNASVGRMFSEGKIEIKRSADANVTLYGLGNLIGRRALYFTVKKLNEKDIAPDLESIVQIEETAGLLRINKEAPYNPANGAIVVDNALAGQITIKINAVETNRLVPNAMYCYDVKMDNTIVGEGKFLVSTSVTRTVS